MNCGGAGDVAISTTSIVRAQQKATGAEFWVQLTTKHPDRTALARAIQDAEDPLDDVNFLLRTSGTVPKGYVALIDSSGDDAQLLVWADDIARRLEHEGVSGRLTGVSSASTPRWMRLEPAEPAAFITWSYGAATSTTDPTRTGWRPDATATRTIAELATRFNELGGDRILLSQGVFEFLVEDTDHLAEMLTIAILTDRIQAGLVRTDDRTHTARFASFMTAAQTVLQIIDDSRDWTARVDELTEAIIAHPGLIDYAVIRRAYRTVSSWNTIDAFQRLPGIREEKFRFTQHLTTTHVVDAHGVQVLTDAQLAGLRDLTNWQVRDLGHARHLVTATDLAPWFGGTAPDPDTVEQARADFAHILLSEQVIEQHPPPWRPGSP